MAVRSIAGLQRRVPIRYRAPFDADASTALIALNGFQAPRKPPFLSAPSSSNRTAIVRHVAETLAFAAAGYLSGSILAVAAASLAGRPMLIPMLPMRILLVLIGISLGAVVTPATLNGMATYPLSIAVLIVAMVCISVSGASYLRVVHGWDKITAYLAAAPGGLSQVMGLAAELDADMRAIAIVQTVRVVI